MLRAHIPYQNLRKPIPIPKYWTVKKKTLFLIYEQSPYLHKFSWDAYFQLSRASAKIATSPLNYSKRAPELNQTPPRPRYTLLRNIGIRGPYLYHQKTVHLTDKHRHTHDDSYNYRSHEGQIPRACSSQSLITNHHHSEEQSQRLFMDRTSPT